MPRLIINTLDGGTLDIAEFKEESIMPILDSWEAGPTLLTVALNDGMAYIPKSSVARIDLIHED